MDPRTETTWPFIRWRKNLWQNLFMTKVLEIVGVWGDISEHTWNVIENVTEGYVWQSYDQHHALRGKIWSILIKTRNKTFLPLPPCTRCNPQNLRAIRQEKEIQHIKTNREVIEPLFSGDIYSEETRKTSPRNSKNDQYSQQSGRIPN